MIVEPKPGFFVVSSVIGRGKYEGIKTGRAVLIKTKEKLALELWREWFKEANGDPTMFDTVMDDNVCIFCERRGAEYDKVDHAPDCIYLRAKGLM